MGKQITNKSGVIALARKEVEGTKIKKFVCRCPECDNVFEMWASHFYRGSNGCECKNLKKQHHRLYGVWENIKTRCQNKNNHNYKRYGERGIELCDEWQDFKGFKEWAYANGYDKNAPRGQCTLDRIDNNKGYSPDNCRWTSIEVQANNKRNNILYVMDGEMLSLRNICVKIGINYKTEHDYYSKHGYKMEFQHLLDKAANIGCNSRINMYYKDGV